jgi:hypothetical protein
MKRNHKLQQMKRPEATQPARAFFIFMHFRDVLEIKLQTELDQARPAIGNNLPERGTSKAAIIHP